MLKKIAAAAAALALTAGAHASQVIFDASGFNSGDVSTQAPGFSTQLFDSPASTGTLTFTLLGFNTLDGANYYEDDFTLTVNGTALLTGAFNLGGGGANVFSGPAGTSILGLNNDPDSVTGAGGALQFTVPVSLLATGNEIDWNYASAADASHAGFQGIGDEGWGLANVVVTASVPEAGSLAMMLAGLGLLVGLACRRAARQA